MAILEFSDDRADLLVQRGKALNCENRQLVRQWQADPFDLSLPDALRANLALLEMVVLELEALPIECRPLHVCDADFARNIAGYRALLAVATQMRGTKARQKLAVILTRRKYDLAA